ncbi:MAG: hypothetical protein WBA57_26695 [Elainellaceae cyanobacterium]
MVSPSTLNLEYLSFHKLRRWVESIDAMLSTHHSLGLSLVMNILSSREYL